MHSYGKTFDEWYTCAHKLMARTDDCQQVLDEFTDKYVRDDVIFSPPTYSRFYRGKGWFKAILNEVSKVIGRSFEYQRTWVNQHNWGLEFTTTLPNGMFMRGIDIISLDSNFKIKELRVLAAPLNSIQFLRDEMASRSPRPKL